MLELIPVKETQRWNETVQSMHEYDFYHLAAYHRLDTSGDASLLYFRYENEAFAFPVIVRDIEGTDYKDITSVYGYAGPLSRNPNPSPESVRLFHQALQKQFEEMKIVSVFARLHPLFEDQSALLNGFGEVTDSNLTIGIDLTLPESEQKRQYARSLKYRINYLKRKGVTIVKASGKEDIDAFIEIYKNNMDRVKAAPSYYFPPEYFYTLLEEIDSCIFLAVYEGEFVSGSLCTFTHGIMQAHLNATKSNCLELSPLKLVLDQARQEGIARRMHCLHLGGGRSGADDSLFVFKSRFSKQTFMFKVWKQIVNPQIYNELVREKYREDIPESEFFPLYRQ